MTPALKLTVYVGERARVAGGGSAADALAEVAARHRLRASVLLRGAEGFGARHGLRTDRQLTLSEDLPLVWVGVDEQARAEAALEDVAALPGAGLVTLERARLADGGSPPAGDEAKLTVYLGRHRRAAGRPAHEAVLDALRGAGVVGATALLGVDGTAHGVRRRATLLGRNADVPLMVVAVGAGPAVAAGLDRIGPLLGDEPLATLERVRLCKRDGAVLAEPPAVPATDPSGLHVWQKLMVHGGDQACHAALVRALRREGAAGATTLRGVRGYHGEVGPHGDTLWQLRRRAPLVSVVVDAPERMRRWFALADELTPATGLVTCELVPARRAGGDGSGGLRLAHLG